MLGLGVLTLFVLLSGVAILLAYSTAPHRVARRPRLRSTSGAQAVAFMARAGLSAPGVVGVRMALEPGEGRSAVPVRSALVGSALAVALVVTTLTFGNSLQTLVSNPPLYGWNWTYILNPVGAGSGNVPQVALSLLKHDPYVAAYSGASYNDAELDGQYVPFLLENVHAPVAPPILSGSGLDAPRDVVLGAATMAELHKRLGQYVTLTYGTPADAPIYLPPTRLLIVGTATFPAIGFASTISDHTSMGTGVLFSNQALPAAFDNAIYSSSDPALDGPNLALVRIRPGAPPAAALASLQRIVRAADKVFADQPGGASGNAIVVQGVQRPAEIVNYRTIGATPTLLVSALALGVIVALALTLVASVRQRRRDLALLKAIGFVQTAVGRRCRLAGHGGRRHRDRRRDPARDRRRPLALGPLCAPDLRSSLPDRVGPVDRPGGDRHPRAGQCRRRRSRPDRSTDTHGHDAAGGMSRSGLRHVGVAQCGGLGAGLHSGDDLAYSPASRIRRSKAMPRVDHVRDSEHRPPRRLRLRSDRHLEVVECSLQLGGAIAPRRIGRGQLRPRRGLAART